MQRPSAAQRVQPEPVGEAVVGEVPFEADLDHGAALPPAEAVALPDYLLETYHWAYLNPLSIRLLDRMLVVEAILWGNFGRLARAAVAELEPGMSVLQPACVYGDLSPRLARRIGAQGCLQVCDVAPAQIANCRPKLSAHANACTVVRDAVDQPPRTFDAVVCFFLLHEVPHEYRRHVVDALLRAVKPGGKVIFVDYHRPHRLHPLRPVMRFIFRQLEPYAEDLWRAPIRAFASEADRFQWSTCTYFGGLYQKVVATAPGEG